MCLEKTSAEDIGQLLRERRETVALAESCTGGSIAKALTAVAGSSSYVWGGVVVYTVEAKAKLLSIEPQAVQQQGAVSAATTEAMAVAIRRLSGSTYGLAVTGWAGPGRASPGSGACGGTDRPGPCGDPVGTVYLGLADEQGVSTRRRRYEGDRAAVRRRATEEALAWLKERLRAPEAGAHG